MTKRMQTWPAEKVSRRAFLILMIIAVVIFALFYGVGFGDLYIDNPNFNAPLFTDVLIVFTLLLLMIAGVIVGVSVIRRIRLAGKEGSMVNGVPETRINRCVVIFTLLCLLVTFLLGSTSSISINGEPFREALWLKVADMFVSTSLVLLLVTTGSVAFEAVWSKKNKGK